MTSLLLPILKGIVLILFTKFGVFTFDLGRIVLTLIIYAISLIFAYSLLLQKEVDGTV